MDTEDIYYDKYQKYKSKYLELKKQIEQSGGSRFTHNHGSKIVVPSNDPLVYGPHPSGWGMGYSCNTDNKKYQCDYWTKQFTAAGLKYPSSIDLNSNTDYMNLNIKFQRNKDDHGYMGDLQNYITYCYNNRECTMEYD